MIPCIVDKQMRQMLDEFGDDIHITQKLRPREAPYLDHDLFEFYGGWYYDENGQLAKFSEDDYEDVFFDGKKEHPEHSQWSNNMVHIMDTENDGINGEEFSAGLSLLLSTYNYIRNKKPEGDFRFFFGADRGVLEKNGDWYNIPSVFVTFYRNYGYPIEDTSKNELNKDDSGGFFVFDVTEDTWEPLNAIEKIDDQWYLTYRDN